MTVTATLAGLKTAIDLLKDALSKRDSKLIESALREINESRLKTEQLAFDLLEKNHDLQSAKSLLAEEKRHVEKELLAMKDFRAELEANYQRSHTPLGSLIYISKMPVPGSEEPERLCANCAAAFQKTYLQPANRNRSLHCPNGHGDIPFKPSEARTLSGRSGGGVPGGWMAR